MIKINGNRESKKQTAINKQFMNYLHTKYKKNFKADGLSLNLSKEQLYHICTKNCIYCGSHPEQEFKTESKETPVIKYNEIDNRCEGNVYSIENTVPCCVICKRAKINMTEEEWHSWLVNLNKFRNNKLDIISNNMLVVCDIDDTLLMYNDKNKAVKGSIKIVHPLNGHYEYPIPHKEHIKLLKSYKNQGYTVIAWSAQGYEWAAAAINALNLNDIVDIRMSKPLKYIDDLRGPEGILGSRVYIPFKRVNKIIESDTNDIK